VPSLYVLIARKHVAAPAEEPRVDAAALATMTSTQQPL
jgi:hypothetical protein